ncbi:Lipoamide acyltransferase component of branched-chain alpha-keto acid dehydrogenase complex, mitochondrial [Apostasia shenzhenica]|uniref:Dihydrolipoamide acetyltransferase component of pyruvate dehydrogenase complex n=1 Tax=Apostasia shenzhenica TaxID=1088818 RepID=A0A2I0AS99_9ASPA|nr:Lipoamide acyltransferase component of branched-chain alpha-keto acid dehydrogenase complex, mitochondrial [Apostasia shenzhenica]
MAARWLRRCARILGTRRPEASGRRPAFPPPEMGAMRPILRRINTAFSPSSQITIGFPFGVWNRRCLSIQTSADSPGGRVMDVPLAQTGEGIAECELLKWLVEEGDHVEEFQPLCEVQSDKATIEITSRFKGKVQEVLYGPGEIVKVGEILLKILVDETPSPLTYGDGGSEGFSDSQLHESKPEQSVGGVLATPSVRHVAKQYGININDISGSGKDGRVLKEDILNFAVSKGICQELPLISSTGGEKSGEFEEIKRLYMASTDGGIYNDKTIPLRGFQRSMVKSMTMAAKVPHFYYSEEINCDALVELKATFQEENSEKDVKHTFMPFLIKSLSMALNKYPLMNSSFNEEANEFILKGCHNVGVAMATPHGLVVPNIKKVQSLSIMEITKELARLQQMALGNKLNTEDITGGTITLSNIGSIGGNFGSPILNLPEVAIIAIGRIQKLPRFSNDGSIYPACITNVTIGADHRTVDGATVARFCNEWKLLIEKPELLILHMK